METNGPLFESRSSSPISSPLRPVSLSNGEGPHNSSSLRTARTAAEKKKQIHCELIEIVSLVRFSEQIAMTGMKKQWLK
jgi:hypothetical protein